VQREGTWSGSPESRPAHIVVQAAAPRNDERMARVRPTAERAEGEEIMKHGTLTSITAITLFAALAIPVRLAAQEQHTHYRLIDLGTFGGPGSGVNLDKGSGASNNRGMAVGAEQTSIPIPPNSNEYSCGAPFVNHAFEWQNSVVTDLGTLSAADNCSNAEWINERGESAGVSENDEIDPLLDVTEIRAVLWKDGQIKDLGTLGGNHSAASSINNRGQVAGFALNAIPDPFSFFDLFIFGSSAGTQTRAFRWQNGAMQDLGTLGGPDAAAFLLNERGQVAGFSYTSSLTIDPFLWENGTMLDLGNLGGTFGGPNALNNRGQVVGVMNLAGDQAQHPFSWRRGILTDIGTFGGSSGVAQWVSESGQVVGSADHPGNEVHTAFSWKDGVMTDLGTVEGDICSTAYGNNSKGQIVGTAGVCLGGMDAFLWENGSIVNLNDMVPPNSILHLVFATAINDRGEIAGNGVPPGVSVYDWERLGHAFLLIPCREGNQACEDHAEGATAVTSTFDRDPRTMTQPDPANHRMVAPFGAHGRRVPRQARLSD